MMKMKIVTELTDFHALCNDRGSLSGAEDYIKRIALLDHDFLLFLNYGLLNIQWDDYMVIGSVAYGDAPS